jgi:CRISPR system Cascade subunit CasE
MYISKIELDPRAVFGQAERESVVYTMHRLVWGLFPRDEKATRDFLFRLDDREDAKILLVVSKRMALRPTWAKNFQTKPYQPVLKVGQRLAFKVRANPVVRGKIDKKRHDVVMHAKRKDSSKELLDQEVIQNASDAWIRKCGARSGFEVLPETLLADSYRQQLIFDGRREIRISTVDLSGILTVSNPTALTASLATGIGSSRSFGCGLLLLRLS